jgi:N-acetylmuramoyl-L-alanine amidase
VSALRFVDHPSPNYDARTRAIDLVVLHYTGMHNGGTALKRLTDPAPLAGHYPGPWQNPSIARDTLLPRVSAHYLVTEEGAIYRLVAEAHRAWHAGVSDWEGDTHVNARSIGIEIINGGHDFGLPDFPLPQVDAVIVLLQQILARWDLKPSRVVAHSDIAPARKKDPGEKFPWQRLAQAGVSIWPEYVAMQANRAPDIALVQSQLKAFGYGVGKTGVLDEPTRLVLEAFQRRFRPAHINGQPDEETQMLLAALTHRAV